MSTVSNVNQWMIRGMQRAGGAPAVIDGSTVLSHAELDAQSNRVARYLAEQGIGRESSVGLCMDRSVDMVTNLIGILKTGAAYVPFDPHYPRERLVMMAEDAKLTAMLCHRIYQDFHDRPLIWEEIEHETVSQPTDSIQVDPDPEQLAYIIFTSGSTGRPKGIAMPHRALANLIEWQLNRSSFQHGMRVLQYSSISFDVSFQEVATTIASGGTLYLISNEDRKDPRRLLAHLIEDKIERLFLPYVALRSMIEAAQVSDIYPTELKEVITAGEQLHVDRAVRDFFSRTGASLDNQYGPSETHVITAHLLSGNPADWPELPSIGTPLDHCGLYILNEAMQPVGKGEEGELYLAGRNLAHGYLSRDDLTREAFVPNPFADDRWPILYKTGDWASYNPDGTIQFLGRHDQQIKVRGHRVEPGEINNVASQLPGIEQCLTRAYSGVDGIKQLTTYYTLKKDASVSERELRRHLSMKLPNYMLPAFLVKIDEWPYTPSGKIDQKALPKPSIQNSQYAGVEDGYRSTTEQALARIWSDLLGLESIPRSADFFELGGDSLRAVTLFLKISQLFGQELPLTKLTEAPTIAALAQVIDGSSAASGVTGYRSLQKIQSGSDEVPPLFLVHGGMGNTLVFNTLVRNLDPRQPVYAFQWSGWDGFPGETSLESMARAYKRELQQLYPEGAVRLGGYCIGGLIAILLAGMLREEGYQVLDPMFMLDTPNLCSSSYRKKEPWDDAERMTEYKLLKEDLLSRTEPFSPTQSVQGDPEPLSSGWKGVLKRVPGLHRTVRFIKWVNAGYPVLASRLQRARVPMEIRGAHCLRIMKKAVRQHKKSVYPGKILYFRSHSVLGRDMGIQGWWCDPFMGSRELCADRFDYYVVGGTHSTIIEVPEIGKLMMRSLETEQRQQKV